jgi:hypothetical protein
LNFVGKDATMTAEIDSGTPANFMAGEIARDGFLGTDVRPIPEIIRLDAEELARFGETAAAAADFLQGLLDEGKKGLEGPVVADGRAVQVRWERGMIPCPFGEPGLHPKITATVSESGSGRTLRFSQLAVHLVRRHGFFGGKGSAFRMEPEEIAGLMRHPII